MSKVKMRKSFLVPCRGAADGVCMVTEKEWKEVWKAIYEEATEQGGVTPGPKPITKPGMYEFIWVDDYGTRHVFTMWVIAHPEKQEEVANV